MPMSGGLIRNQIALFSTQAQSQTVTNSTTETAWSLDKTVMVPANTLTAGCSFRVMQAGVYQAGLSQNVTPRIRIGPSATALASRTELVNPGAVSGLLNAAVDTPWMASTVHTILSDGSISSWGQLSFATSATAALSIVVASKTTKTGVDFTQDLVVTASAQWGSALTANQITCTGFTLEVIKP